MQIIIFVGYTKIRYVRQVKQTFTQADTRFVCVYERAPITRGKKKYIEQFDECFDLNDPNTLKWLAAQEPTSVVVTCTQERDMGTYIKTLTACRKVTAEQARLYQACINKKDFKEYLRTSAPELVPQVTEVDEAFKENSSAITYPIVLKPTGLAGSFMVRIIRNSSDLDEYLEVQAARVHDVAGTFFNKQVEIIAEEYIAGNQYSVNAYVNATGTAILCPVIRVVTPQELAVEDTYSALQYPTTLSDVDQQSLTEAIQRILDTFQIKDTSVHFDCALTESGWKFFEVGLRIGGKREEMFSKSHGFSHIINDIRNRLGLTPFLPSQSRFVCMVQKASEVVGTLRSISYSRTVSEAESALIQEDKLGKLAEPVAPLCRGGGVVTRHFVVGNENEKVVALSKHLFEDITFVVD